jgi:GMP synthase-like glutamine amidotransferase
VAVLAAGLWLRASAAEGYKGDAIGLRFGGVPAGATLQLANGFGSWAVSGDHVDEWHLVAEPGSDQLFTLTASDGSSASCSVRVKRRKRDLVWAVWYDWWDKGYNKSDHENVSAGGLDPNLPPGVSRQLIGLYESGGADHFSGAHPDQERLLAVVLLGSFPWWETWPADKAAELNTLKQFIRTTGLPLLAFCGGHQLVAKAFGGDLELCEGQDRATRHVGHCFPSLDRFIDGASDIIGNRDAPTSDDLQKAHPDEVEDNFQDENGRPQPMTLTAAGAADPIFAGLAGPARPSFMLWHHDWVQARPDGFVELARSDLTVVPAGSDASAGRAVGGNQCLRHSSKLIYTSQFHPEQDFRTSGTQGNRYLQNFFKLATASWGGDA